MVSVRQLQSDFWLPDLGHVYLQLIPALSYELIRICVFDVNHEPSILVLYCLAHFPVRAGERRALLRDRVRDWIRDGLSPILLLSP